MSLSVFGFFFLADEAPAQVRAEEAGAARHEDTLVVGGGLGLGGRGGHCACKKDGGMRLFQRVLR